jgi:hypothetical protein
MQIIDTTVEGNRAEGSGGALAHSLGDTALSGATLANNSSNAGGAIFNQGGGSITLVNSTLSGNRAFSAEGPFGPLPGRGGVLYMGSGEARLKNTTIASNLADDRGAAISSFGSALVQTTNSLFAVNLTNGLQSSCDGPVSSGGHNVEDADSCSLDQSSDRPNTDSRLGPLDANGGPTRTHALLGGSPAIDSGDNAACPLTDQRGSPRPADGNLDGSAVCDIGAYEVEGPPPAAPSPAPTAAATEHPAATPDAALPAQLPPTGGRPYPLVPLPPQTSRALPVR